MSEVRAKLSRLPVSGFKVRLLADQIRGKYVSDALDILSFSKKASSKNLTFFSISSKIFLTFKPFSFAKIIAPTKFSISYSAISLHLKLY